MLVILVTLVMMVEKMSNRKADGRRPRVFTEQARMQKLLISKWNMKVFCLYCISVCRSEVTMISGEEKKEIVHRQNRQQQ